MAFNILEMGGYQKWHRNIAAFGTKMLCGFFKFKEG